MARIPVHLIREIVTRSDFVGTLSHYLTLRPAQGRLIALCPFHKEKSPSFSANPERGLWYCFGCHAGGDLFHFLMRIEGWSFQEAARELGRRVGVDVDELSPEERQRLNARQRLQDALQRAAAHYHGLLKTSAAAIQARAYLERRGIGSEVIDAFQLGYAPGGPGYLLDHLRQHGYAEQEITEAGLATRNEGSRRSVDMFRDRVIFPIVDTHGRVIAMGGRILGEGQPKYLNSPETSLYSKRQHLYGLYQARSSLRTEEAILVEGYMDVVTLHQAGFTQAVASLGTALTAEQANLLRRYAQYCVLAYDADNAGQNATDKGIEIFEAASLPARVLEMPPGEDPDSLLRTHGEASFRRLLDDARSVVEYRMETLIRKHAIHTPEGKNRFLHEMLPSLDRVRDLVRWDEYVRRIAERLEIREETVRKMARSHRPESPAAHLTLAAPEPRGGKGRFSRDAERGQGSSGRGQGPYQERRGSNAGNRTGGRYGRSWSGRDERFLPEDVPQQEPENTLSGVPKAVFKAEQQLVRYLLHHTHALPEARATVSPDEFQDGNLRAVLRALYAQESLPPTLCAVDLVPLLDEEGVHEQVSELLFQDAAEPLTQSLFAGLLDSFRKRRDRAEVRALGRTIRQTNRDRATRSHDDPNYLKFQELNQRLKGSP